MKRLSGLIILLASFLFLLSTISMKTTESHAAGHEMMNEDGIVVLELFTSQGCSSCPPADELLKEVKQSNRDNVYTIAYHVDYWNYIGWEDPFSTPEFTAKQTEYNKKFRSKSNYTPQLVVNGKHHFVGSNAQKLYQNIQLYGSVSAENQIMIKSVDRDLDRILLEYEIEGPIHDKRLRAVLLIDERITNVQRGENRNRTLVNSNIAVAEAKRSIDQKSGSTQIILPDLIHPNDDLKTVLIVENENSDILGATSIAIP